MKNAMTVVILSVLLAAVGITTFIVLNELTAVTLSMHGYIALGLGIGFTLILGCALMYLVFYSSHSGHDASAQSKLED